MNVKKHILPIIVIAQLFCTSLWFAGNGVMDQLIKDFELSTSAVGHLTSAVQLGFISGTLLFAILMVVDRFSPSLVFFICAIAGSISNLGMTLEMGTLYTLLASRFLTGFFLAGIYPVGMKIATDYYKEGLGKSLGYLVGAVVLGTALPHLFKCFVDAVTWKIVLYSTSILAVFGGLLLYSTIRNGPYRTASQKLNMSTFFMVFKNRKFRGAAFGYFGHMWELYAFWTVVPLILACYNSEQNGDLNISLVSFFIIGIGFLSCIAAGASAQKFGTSRMAKIILTSSGICCLLSPLLFYVASPVSFVGFLLFWGIVVVADSPLFSTLVAQNADPEVKGTALIIVTCIGFSITIISIELLSHFLAHYSIYALLVFLGIGPLFGVLSIQRNFK